MELVLLLQKLKIVHLENFHNHLKSSRQQILSSQQTYIQKGRIVNRTFYDENLENNQLAINLRNKIQTDIFTLHKRRLLRN